MSKYLSSKRRACRQNVAGCRQDVAGESPHGKTIDVAGTAARGFSSTTALVRLEASLQIPLKIETSYYFTTKCSRWAEIQMGSKVSAQSKRAWDPEAGSRIVE